VASVDFEEVFLAEYGKLVRHLCLQGATQHEADDAVQAAFEQALMQWGSIRAPRPWLYTVALRLYLNGDVRVRQREAPSSDPLTGQCEPADDDPAVYADHERAAVDAVRALPYQQRLIMASTIAEFTPKEIAEQLGCSAEAVRQNLRRARVTLSGQLKSMWEDAR
jgi:RNA polymerase sigma factor (sigma-70 family)